MAASAWRKYEIYPVNLGNKVYDMDGDVFKIALYLSTSNAATVTTNEVKGDLTNEHANANGYTTGGIEVTETWTRSVGTTTFDCSDPVWTASGGSIIARFAVLWDDTPASPLDPLIAYALLDTTPADVVVTDGNTLTLQINASGVFQVSGMTA